tara:strand:- start:329 stop:1015 length:687 start_codon:yes stop_codon:yes gene_type:complete
LIKNHLSHIAFILDGNKRWAKKNNLTNLNGYVKGFENIKKIVDHSINIKLTNLTLFTLSSENLNRPSVNLIYDIIYKNFSNLLDELINKKNIKINIFGSRENLPKKINEIFNDAEKLSINNKNLNLNLAFNYGFKDEIRDVLIKFNSTIKDKLSLNEEEIRKLFYLGSTPDPEILIRTGGYKRLSNFIMYNLTYTELFFTETLWPDFKTSELDKIVESFSNINRKYGL